jgi:hypothetical protein
MPTEDLRKLLDTINQNLAQGRYPNETAVREAIVLPVLQRLGWDVLDPSVVRREYPVGGRKVDYGLFVHPSTPDLLIEVKAVGSISGGDKQLFEYAFHDGVPMVLLTDGREWSFYLPAGQGSYDDRRVYKLDFLERDPKECCQALTRYLAFERVRQKEAIADARSDYETAARGRTAADTLQAAWQKLVEEPDGLLIDLLVEKTQGLCGYAPTREQVEAFLTGIAPVGLSAGRPAIPRGAVGSAPNRGVPPTREGTASTSEPGRSGRGIVQVVLDGRKHDAKDAISGLKQILCHLAAKDATFLERLEVRARGKSRNHLARSREAVYPHRPDLAGNAVELVPGWFLDTNISNREKLKIVRHACEVAKLRQGSDIDLIAPI